MTDPEITVLVSAKNAEKTIARAMTSVLSSLPRSGRMIVRSDGSDDRTLETARGVADARVEVLEDETWLGIAESGNELLRRVETPLVTRMDADDISLPGRLPAQLRRIRAGIDFSFTTGLYWKEGTPVLKPQKPYAITPASAPFILLLTNPFMHPTMLAKTEAVRAIGGYRKVASEDFDLYLRAAAAGYRLERTRLPRMIYRRTPTQTTAQASWWKAREANPLVHEAFNALSEHALGFVPCWFEWRRAGFPTDSVPEDALTDIERFRSAIAGLSRAERAPLARRLDDMARRARGPAGASA